MSCNFSYGETDNGKFYGIWTCGWTDLHKVQDASFNVITYKTRLEALNAAANELLAFLEKSYSEEEVAL